MQTRTGSHASASSWRYSSGRSTLSELRLATDITCHWTSIGRTSDACRIQRDPFHAHGQRGSNQQSATARSVAGAVVAASVLAASVVAASVVAASVVAASVVAVPGPTPDAGPRAAR